MNTSIQGDFLSFHYIIGSKKKNNKEEEEEDKWNARQPAW